MLDHDPVTLLTALVMGALFGVLVVGSWLFHVTKERD